MEIDVKKVAGVAVGLEQSSEVVDGVAGVVAGSAFGGDTAGRNYADVGVRIAMALDGVEASLRRWGEACKDDAVRLRAGIVSYREADDGAAHSVAILGGQQ